MDPNDQTGAPAPSPVPSDASQAASTPAPAPTPAPAAAEPAKADDPGDAIDAMTAALSPAAEDGATQAPRAPDKKAKAASAAPKGKEKPAASTGKAAEGDGDTGGDSEGEDDPYAMPEGLSDRAKTRFEDLSRRAKEGEGWKQRAEQWQQTIESTGATPDQFGQMLTYSRLVNSGDPTQLRQALAVLESERATIAKALGEEVPGIDLLSDHPDLLQRVQLGEMDRNSALEVARARTSAAAAQQMSQAQRQQQEETVAHRQAVDGLNQLGAQLAAQDPQYEAKYELLKPMIPIIAQMPPHQWGEAFMQVYRGIALPATAAAPAPTPASMQRMPATPQPLRNTGAGGSALQQQAASAQDAIEQALGFGV